jgi:putative ABC transport system substrate-binding protein
MRLRIVLILLCFSGVALAKRIVVIKNTDHPKYDDPARALRAALGQAHQLEVITLGQIGLEAAKKKAEAIKKRSPSLVIALGDKATYLAQTHLPDTPFLFGMVANWESLKVDQARASGVAMQLAPETMTSQLKTFLPTRRRIGVIYTQHSKAYVERAMRKAASLEMTMIPIFVQSGDEFPEVLEAIAGVVDIFWLVEDPEIVKRTNLEALLNASRSNGLPVVTYSTGLVEGGLTMSITVDRLTVGNQLAALAKTMVAGASPHRFVVQPPDKTLISLNKQSMTALRLQLDPMLLSFAQVLDTRSQRRKRLKRRK